MADYKEFVKQINIARHLIEDVEEETIRLREIELEEREERFNTARLDFDVKYSPLCKNLKEDFCVYLDVKLDGEWVKIHVYKSGQIQLEHSFIKKRFLDTSYDFTKCSDAFAYEWLYGDLEIKLQKRIAEVVEEKGKTVHAKYEKVKSNLEENGWL